MYNDRLKVFNVFSTGCGKFERSSRYTVPGCGRLGEHTLHNNTSPTLIHFAADRIDIEINMKLFNPRHFFYRLVDVSSACLSNLLPSTTRVCCCATNTFTYSESSSDSSSCLNLVARPVVPEYASLNHCIV